MLITEKTKEISKLPAGPEIDLMIAKALGWKCPDCKGCDHSPQYSTNYYASFVLRLEMQKLGWDSNDRITWMGWGDKNEHPYGYSVWFERWDKHVHYNLHAHIKDCEKAPLAVARAALLALTNKAAGRDGSAADALKELKQEGVV
jgi:hypothetical protein